MSAAVYDHLKFLSSARLHSWCLTKPDQRYGCLFHFILDIISGIWRLHIKLYGFLASHFTSISHGNLGMVLMICLIIRKAIVAIVKSRVRKTVTKWECHIVTVNIIACGPVCIIPSS